MSSVTAIASSSPAHGGSTLNLSQPSLQLNRAIQLILLGRVWAEVMVTSWLSKAGMPLLHTPSLLLHTSSKDA